MSIKPPRVVEGSCLPCRKKRLKCDLTAPTCTKCSQIGRLCTYDARQLQWVGGPAVRGKLKDMSPDSPGSPPTGALSTTCSSRTLTPSPRSTPSLLPSPLVREALVMYFSNVVLPRLQISDQNLHLDEKTVQGEPALREAILAVSQAHHQFLYASERDACPVRHARHLALSQLRGRIEGGVRTTSDAQHLFQVIVLFCILDGVIYPEGESKAPLQHLHGGFSPLKQWEAVPSTMLLQGGLSSHLFSVFASMDLFSSMLSGDKPFFDPNIWLMFADVQAWWGKIARADWFLALLKAMSELAALGAMVHKHGEEGVRLAEKCIGPVLQNLQRPSAVLCCPDFTVPPEWETFCTLYEACATIYVDRALKGLPLDGEKVQATVRKCVSSLIDQPLSGMLAHCLISPLLIFGAHCIHAQDRRAILQALSPSVSYLAFGNLVLMREFLQDLWSQGQSQGGWWDQFKPVSVSLF